MTEINGRRRCVCGLLQFLTNHTEKTRLKQTFSWASCHRGAPTFWLRGIVILAVFDNAGITQHSSTCDLHSFLPFLPSQLQPSCLERRGSENHPFIHLEPTISSHLPTLSHPIIR